MAEIKFKGFVQKHEGNRPWDVTEGHSRKDENDKWVTVARTFHKVWLPREHPGLAEGDLVEIVGQKKTLASEREGKKYFNLVVYAEQANVVKTGNQSPAPAAPARTEPAVDAWAPSDESLPF